MNSKQYNVILLFTAITGRRVLYLVYLTSALLMSTFLSASERELEIQLNAKISERCEIVVIPLNGHKMDFSYSSENSATLKINCNRPMALSVRSEHGALVAIDHQGNRISDLMIDSDVSLQKHYRTYTTEISIADIGFQARTSSRELRNGIVFNTGPKIPFASRGMLKVQLDAPLVFSGTYQDILHLEVSPSSGTGGI